MKKQYTTPSEDVDVDRSIYTILQDRVERMPEQTLVEYRDKNNQWHEMSATEFTTLVRELAKGLLASGVGGNLVAYSLRVDRAGHRHHGNRRNHCANL